ncbi:hypothetical protein [Mycetocola sp. 2940]|uniref:hypothetical protein n=1 Tax=Mycetocola sp. 2940 TaxID=3156452 RepID=UPI0033916D61
MLSTEGLAVSHHKHRSSPEHTSGPDEPTIPELEIDETVAPRPEEDIADVLRAEPDVEDHSEHHK